MAEFKAGDRVVKMSGAAAGKYGTVNSVRDDGTLNVTFDGERLPRFCDPERCGQVGVNAKFKVGDRVRSAKYPELGEMKIVRVFQDIHGTAYRTSRDGFLTDDVHYDRTLIPANSRAANAARNAVARNAGRYELVEHDMGRSFGVYDSATSGYIADDIPLRDALRILKTKGETAEQAKKDLDWTDPAAIDRLW